MLIESEQERRGQHWTPKVSGPTGRGRRARTGKEAIRHKCAPLPGQRPWEHRWWLFSPLKKISDDDGSGADVWEILGASPHS